MAAKIELTLLLDRFKNQVREAGSELEKTLSKAAGGAPGTPLAGAFSKSLLARNPGLADWISRRPSSSVDQGMLFKGIVAGMFSPWVGARLINQSGIGGSGGGGFGGALFGGGGVGGFGAAFIGLQVASRALRFAFDSLKNSVQQAAQLFFEAARLRSTPGDVMARSTILRALGVSNPESLLQTLQYHRGTLSGGTVAQIAGLGGQQGGADFVANLVNRDKTFWNEMANNSREFHVAWTAFSYELQRLSATLADAFLPSLTSGIVVIEKFTQDFNQMLDFFSAIYKIATKPALVNVLSGSAFDFTGKGIFGDRTNTPGSSAFVRPQLHMSEFERMGFVLGRNLMGGASDAANKTAQNTSEIVNILNVIAGKAVGSAVGNVLSTVLTIQSLPK